MSAATEMVRVSGESLTKEASRAHVQVANPKNVRFMTTANFGETMPENLRRRIAHGLTQRYPAFD